MTAYEQATATTETSSDQPVTETARAQASAVAGTAKEEAGTVAGAATHAASEVAGTAKEQVAEVAGAAKYQIGALTNQAKEQAAEQARTQTRKAASTARDFADQLQALSRGERAEGVAADVVRDIGRRVQQIATKLENSEPQELLDEVRRYARNRPGMFLLGAAAAGFVSGRLVKGATAETDTAATAYADRAGDGRYYPPTTTSTEFGTGYGTTAPGYGSATPGTGVGYPSTYGAETYPEEPRQDTGLGGSI